MRTAARRDEENGESATPSIAQRIRYACGGTLPPSMSDWVIDDLTGPGAARRYLLRILIPIIPPLCLFLLIPGPLWMGLAMMALLYLPLIYFTVALMYVYRRHRLAKHGLDPALADVRERDRAAAERAAYERRHGRG
ncbi:DUF5313 family protein [Nocardia arthritidis]|uniref:DUF5313 domain-containing protein n=1 Tax=Nocardia arthritidis TaxID=228602 RepID=A0A6G9YE58_9NOCA|nr:DUF5313 family protein [Nocardia arthritidis]QIS11336.1 hypothetical protein F5544_17300 [Nocardia arthritidis]